MHSNRLYREQLWTSDKTETKTRPLRKLLSKLDRMRYQAQHKALMLFLGTYMAFWHRIVAPKFRPTMQALENLRRSMDTLLETDLDNVENGYYPRELLFSFPFRSYLRVLPEALMDQPRVLWRASRQKVEDLPKTEELSKYPEYYQQTFHWQTDGWLSDRSARLYDFSVELLFGGMADVMRRMVLPPVVDSVRGMAKPRIVDIACGTGRLLSAMAQALPESQLVGVDLSPYYVDQARRTMPANADASFVAENAEHLSFEDQSFDVATSVFLFHELPREARRRAVREAFRVLKPGGRFVISDAGQLRDSRDIESFLQIFPDVYHEPYFKDYLQDDLESLLESCGFEVEKTSRHYLSKVVVARKPLNTPNTQRELGHTKARLRPV